MDSKLVPAEMSEDSEYDCTALDETARLLVVNSTVNGTELGKDSLVYESVQHCVTVQILMILARFLQLNFIL